MQLTWNDLTVNVSNIDSQRLLGDWTWLIGHDKSLVLVSSIGDVFLKDISEKVYWLDVGTGKLSLVANSTNDFKNRLKDTDSVNDWFLPGLIGQLKAAGLELADQELYSYKVLPVLGGEYHPDNFEPTDIEVHFSMAGQIHKKVKDLPDGTKIDSINFT